jgi:hypothetical protein
MAIDPKDAPSCSTPIILLCFALVVWFFLPDSYTDRIKYSFEYNCPSDQVHRSPRPTDCDWGHAPLGDKDCHYKKIVSAYNAAEYVVAGDGAAIYGGDQATGKVIVSYDDRKTWQILTPDSPALDRRVKSVEISWVKAME